MYGNYIKDYLIKKNKTISENKKTSESFIPNALSILEQLHLLFLVYFTLNIF